MKNRNFILCIIAVLALAFTSSAVVGRSHAKLTFADLSEQKHELQISNPMYVIEKYNSDEPFESYAKMSDSFTSAFDMCELAVIANFTGQKDFTDEAIYYEMQVEKVLKGEINTSKLTFIAEISIYAEGNDYNIYSNPNGLGILQKGEKYLLLLTKVKNDLNFPYPAELNNPYLLSTNSIFDFYQLSGAAQTAYYPAEGDYGVDIKTLADVLPNTQVFVTSAEDLQKYNHEREAALNFAMKADKNLQVN